MQHPGLVTIYQTEPCLAKGGKKKVKKKEGKKTPVAAQSIRQLLRKPPDSRLDWRRQVGHISIHKIWSFGLDGGTYGGPSPVPGPWPTFLSGGQLLSFPAHTHRWTGRLFAWTVKYKAMLDLTTQISTACGQRSYPPSIPDTSNTPPSLSERTLYIVHTARLTPGCRPITAHQDAHSHRPLHTDLVLIWEYICALLCHNALIQNRYV